MSSGGVISTLKSGVGCPVGVALTASGSMYISDMCSSSIYVVRVLVDKLMLWDGCGSNQRYDAFSHLGLLSDVCDVRACV